MGSSSAAAKGERVVKRKWTIPQPRFHSAAPFAQGGLWYGASVGAGRLTGGEQQEAFLGDEAQHGGSPQSGKLGR